MYLHNRVKAFDNFNEYGTETDEIDVKKCIKYVAHAWDNVTNVTIKNCWIKADIMPTSISSVSVPYSLNLSKALTRLCKYNFLYCD